MTARAPQQQASRRRGTGSTRRAVRTASNRLISGDTPVASRASSDLLRRRASQASRRRHGTRLNPVAVFTSASTRVVMSRCCAWQRLLNSGHNDSMRAKAAKPRSSPGRVAVLTYDGLSMFEFSVACEVFGTTAAGSLAVPWYELVVCADADSVRFDN